MTTCAAWKWGGKGHLSWARLVHCGNKLQVTKEGDTAVEQPPQCVFMCLSSLCTLCQTVSLVLSICQVGWPVSTSFLPMEMLGFQMYATTFKFLWVLGIQTCTYTCTASALPSPVASTFDLIKSSQDSVRSLEPPPIEQESAIKSFAQGHSSVPMPEQ